MDNIDMCLPGLELEPLGDASRVHSTSALSRERFMRLTLNGLFNLRLIQQFRLHLQAAKLADVCDVEGTKTKQWAYHTPGWNNRLHWPTQGHSSWVAWSKCKHFLNSLLGDPSRAGGRFLK